MPLYKFIEIAQMPVVKRAVVTASDAEVEYPADILGDLRYRILLQRSPLPVTGTINSGGSPDTLSVTLLVLDI
jgi:hypothetical protein